MKKKPTYKWWKKKKLPRSMLEAMEWKLTVWHNLKKELAKLKKG